MHPNIEKTRTGADTSAAAFACLVREGCEYLVTQGSGLPAVAYIFHG